VGKTTQHHSTRTDQHYRGSNSVRCVHLWTYEERWLGYDIYSIEIEKCPDKEVFEREKYWSYRIPNKINERNNYYLYGFMIENKDKNHIRNMQINKIKYLRDTFQDNWNGYVGIRYYYKHEAWRVHLQPEHFRHKWLTETDGGPLTMDGWTNTWRRKIYYVGDHYFADPNNAIAARDRARDAFEEISFIGKRRQLRWPPDANPFFE
jgi:hypothetical protein